jgi:hypothetical protein
VLTYIKRNADQDNDTECPETSVLLRHAQDRRKCPVSGKADISTPDAYDRDAAKSRHTLHIKAAPKDRLY